MSLSARLGRLLAASGAALTALHGCSTADRCADSESSYAFDLLYWNVGGGVSGDVAPFCGGYEQPTGRQIELTGRAGAQVSITFAVGVARTAIDSCQTLDSIQAGDVSQFCAQQPTAAGGSIELACARALATSGTVDSLSISDATATSDGHVTLTFTLRTSATIEIHSDTTCRASLGGLSPSWPTVRVTVS